MPRQPTSGKLPQWTQRPQSNASSSCVPPADHCREVSSSAVTQRPLQRSCCPGRHHCAVLAAARERCRLWPQGCSSPLLSAVHRGAAAGLDHRRGRAVRVSRASGCGVLAPMPHTTRRTASAKAIVLAVLYCGLLPPPTVVVKGGRSRFHIKCGLLPMRQQRWSPSTTRHPGRVVTRTAPTKPCSTMNALQICGTDSLRDVT